jgi:glutamate carboxypeptidase
VTVNVGSIEGGGPVNVVPDLASCRFNVRVANSADEQLFQNHFRKVSEEINDMDGISLDIRGGVTRPPKPLDRRTHQALEHVAACGRDLGMTIRWQPSGGSCDGNNLAATGLPTIDSLGVRGGEIHSAREYVFLDSLAERAKLTALLLMKLGSREIAL